MQSVTNKNRTKKPGFTMKLFAMNYIKIVNLFASYSFKAKGERKDHTQILSVYHE